MWQNKDFFDAQELLGAKDQLCGLSQCIKNKYVKNYNLQPTYQSVIYYDTKRKIKIFTIV